jgi:hypothetical protein
MPALPRRFCLPRSASDSTVPILVVGLRLTTNQVGIGPLPLILIRPRGSNSKLRRIRLAEQVLEAYGEGLEKNTAVIFRTVGWWPRIGWRRPEHSRRTSAMPSLS